MRPGDRDDFGRVLSLIRFPEKRVAFLNASQSGGLAARNVKVQVRPPAAPAFLAQDADLLAHADLRSGPNSGVNRLQMAVAIVPATVVEQIDHVVARFRGAVIVTRQNVRPGRNHSPGSGCNNVCHSFRSATVESVMVINRLVARHFPAIDKRRLVGHLRVAGEPALLEWINKRARLDPRRANGPEPEPRVLQQTPRVPLAALPDVALGNGAVNLNA